MGNGAFSEISAFLKNVRGAFGDWLRYFLIKISAYILGGENILRKTGLFLQVFYPILKCGLSRNIGRRVVARLFF